MIDAIDISGLQLQSSFRKPEVLDRNFRRPSFKMLLLCDVPKEFEIIAESWFIINRPTTSGYNSYFVADTTEDNNLNSSSSESEDELSLGIGKQHRNLKSLSQRQMKDNHTDFMIFLDTIDRLTEQIDKLNESLECERNERDALREDNLELKFENLKLQLQLKPSTVLTSPGTTDIDEKSRTEEILEIRTDLINKGGNGKHKKTSEKITIELDESNKSQDTSTQKEQ